MRERAALLNIVAELRGRLDELEAMIRTAPNHAIITPASYDEEGVVDLTPEAYRAFRGAGLETPLTLDRYTPFGGFTQVGAPPGAGSADLTAFALSDLHRVGPDPAFGLHFQPRDTQRQDFFTYEFLTEAEGLAQYHWLEWVVKLALERPTQCFLQFIVEGEGFSERVDVGTTLVGDFATFSHVRLDRGRLLDAAAGRAVQRLRLTFSTAGDPIAMDIYALALFGRV